MAQRETSANTAQKTHFDSSLATQEGRKAQPANLNWYDNGRRNARAAASESANHLNTPRVVEDATQKVVWRWDQAEPNEDPDGDSINFSFQMRFPGQYADGGTGTAYNYFRDFDPGLGAYKQSDPIGLLGALNTYTYVGSNPLGSWDTWGLQGKPPRIVPVDKLPRGTVYSEVPGRPDLALDPVTPDEATQGFRNPAREKPPTPEPEPVPPIQAPPPVPLPWWRLILPRMPIMIDPCLLDPSLPPCAKNIYAGLPGGTTSPSSGASGSCSPS